MPRALIVEILGNAKQFGAELDRAAGKTRSMGKVAGVAGLAIAGGLAVGLDKSVKAAEAGQQSTARLDLAFKNSGESAGKYASQITGAEDSGRKLGFTNVETRDSLASLEVATHNHTLALKSMATAEDLARYKHISLDAATKALTMAQTGSQRALKQLGLTIPPVTTAQDALKAKYQLTTSAIRLHYQALGTLTNAQKTQEQIDLDNAKSKEKDALATAKVSDTQKTAASITDLLNQKLHGQADAYSHTAQGGVAVMHANIEALEENLGNALIPAITAVSGKIAALTGFFAQHGTVVKIMVAGLAVLATTLLAISVATKLQAAATTVWSAATKVATAVQWLLNAALDANPIGIVVIALGALVAAIVIAWQHSQTFRTIVKDAFDKVRGVVGDFVSFFTTTLPQAFTTVKDKLKSALIAAKTWVGDHWPEIATLLSGPFAPVVALATGAFGIRAKLTQAWKDIKNDAKGAVGDIVGAVSGIGQGIGNAIIGAINTLISILDAVHFSIGKVSVLGHTLFGGLDWHPFHIPHLATLAQGGIVSRPTLGLIGEAGPEAVVPLARARNPAGVGGGLGGGGNEIHIHFEGNVFGDKAAVARELVGSIREELVRIGLREPTIFTRPGVTP